LDRILPVEPNEEAFARAITEAAERQQQGTFAGMAAHLAVDMGEMALELAQFRASQGAARDETKEIMKEEREK
jgi:hypothetical protein